MVNIMMSLYTWLEKAYHPHTRTSSTTNTWIMLSQFLNEKMFFWIYLFILILTFSSIFGYSLENVQVAHTIKINKNPLFGSYGKPLIFLLIPNKTWTTNFIHKNKFKREHILNSKRREYYGGKELVWEKKCPLEKLVIVNDQLVNREIKVAIIPLGEYF